MYLHDLQFTLTTHSSDLFNDDLLCENVSHSTHSFDYQVYPMEKEKVYLNYVTVRYDTE